MKLIKQFCIHFLLSFFLMIGIAIPMLAQTPNNHDTAVFASRRDLIDVLRKIFKLEQVENDSSRIKKKIQFSIIPVAGSVAGGGTAIATAFNAAFYTGNESSTSLSTITFTPW